MTTPTPRHGDPHPDRDDSRYWCHICEEYTHSAQNDYDGGRCCGTCRSPYVLNTGKQYHSELGDHRCHDGDDDCWFW
jgi:hypothetical protein